MARKRCYNCKYSGEPFKVVGKTHFHCEHPKYDAAKESGDLSPWETLQEFWWSCPDHESKTKPRDLRL